MFILLRYGNLEFTDTADYEDFLARIPDGFIAPVWNGYLRHIIKSGLYAREEVYRAELVHRLLDWHSND